MVKVKRKRSATSGDESKVLVDWISVLPAEILGFIFSFLTLKEATATSILSRQWKYFWTLTPKLDLDGRAFLRKVENTELEKERRNYVEWVNSVIALHKSVHQRSNLEEFRVFFDLNIYHRECIDEWLNYALSKKVRKLDLNLIDVWGHRTCQNHNWCYTFPYEKGNFPDNFKLLVKLSMHLVNVSGEAVELFLGNCPLLEQVSLSQAQVLSYLKIISPFPSFKCLEISDCHALKSVVVHDSNVVTIKYCGMGTKFSFFNVPQLTQLWIGGDITDRMDDVAKMFSSVLPQLEVFKICFGWRALYHKRTKKFASAVEMCNLKQLVVSLWRGYNDSETLLPVIYLIRASPHLHRFVLEAPHEHGEHQNVSCYGSYSTRELSETNLSAYSHLKVVEFVGYCGVISQFKLIQHFVEKDNALENIVVDPRCIEFHLHHPWVCIPLNKFEDEIAARAKATEQLKDGSRVSHYGCGNGVGTLTGEHPYGEHPSRTLFVRNINSNVENSELKSLFEVY